MTVDRVYFRERAAEERDAAARASCMVKDVHLELAELYDLAEESQALPASAGNER